MSEEIIPSATNEQSSAGGAILTHLYYELGNDVLAKPNALADILQVESNPATAIFCNSPSEADMVDVMLKKRGIQTSKLIGHVPGSKVAQAVSRAETGEIPVIVVTDVAARDLEVDTLKLIINYSIPEEPEIYLHRFASHTSKGNALKIISLVSPLDLRSFHYLKKVVDFDLTKIEPPTKEQALEAQAKKLASDSQQGPHMTDERVQYLLPQILESPDRNTIVALLLHNTYNVMPGLSSAAERASDQSRARSGDDRDWDRGGSDRDGGGRGDRGDRRFDRGDRRGGRDRRDSDSDYGDDGDSYRGRGPREDLPPPRRDVRMYIGRGSKSGLTETTLADMIEKNCEVARDSLQRCAIRELYTFADVPEEVADQVIEKLSAGDGGGDLFVRKATVISAPREESQGEFQGDSEEGSNGIGNGAGGDMAEAANGDE